MKDILGGTGIVGDDTGACSSSDSWLGITGGRGDGGVEGRMVVDTRGR